MPKLESDGYINVYDLGNDRAVIATHEGIEVHKELLRLREENKTMKYALSVYADKNNWTQQASAYYLTGVVRPDGFEEEREVSIELDDYFVWDWGGYAGYELAAQVIATLKDMGNESTIK